MRISPLGSIGAVILAVAVAACTGNTSTPAPPPPTNGTANLGTSPTLQSFTAGDYSGVFILPTGSGTVTGAASTTPPGSLTAIMSAARTTASTVSTQATTANTALVYLTYSGTGSLDGLPGVSVTLPAAPATGTKFYEAQWNGAQWLTVGTTTGTISGSKVTFNAGTTPITLSASAPIYVAIYTGALITLPTPSPSPTAKPSTAPSTAANVIANGDFESGSLTPIGTFPTAPVVTSSGWSQCSINRQGAAPSPSPYPFAKYTPTPSETPGAYIDAAGTSIASAPSPAPPIGNVVANSPTHAAVLGGYFYDYSFNDYTYNGICQQVTIPANATLSMYVLGSGGNGSSTTTSSNFQFVVDLLDTSNNFVANLYSEFNQSDMAYRQISSASTTGFSSLSPYAGKTYQLFIGTWVGTTGSRIGFYFVDDVSMKGS